MSWRRSRSRLSHTGLPPRRGAIPTETACRARRVRSEEWVFQGVGVRLSAQSDELPCMTDPVRLEEACRSLLGEPQGLKLACGQWIPRWPGALRHRFR